MAMLKMQIFSQFQNARKTPRPDMDKPPVSVDRVHGPGWPPQARLHKQDLIVARYSGGGAGSQQGVGRP